jgi:serine/threonine protein kinase
MIYFPIVEKCLEKDPDDRYQSFSELRNEMEEYYEGGIRKKTGIFTR